MKSLQNGCGAGNKEKVLAGTNFESQVTEQDFEKFIIFNWKVDRTFNIESIDIKIAK